MPPKRKHGPSLEDQLQREWCWYCEREFDDRKVLITHQRIKHFKCADCHKRLDTAGGLMVHVQNVHKEVVEKIENALPGRENPRAQEIWGMIGAPEEWVEEKKNAYIADYKRREAEHLARTGNPLAGSAEAMAMAERAAKKQKTVPTETKEELQARVKAHIAARKAAKAAKEAGIDVPSPANSSSDAMQQARSSPQNAAMALAPAQNQTQYPQPYYGGPQYSGPQHGSPVYGTPQFPTPVTSTPPAYQSMYQPPQGTSGQYNGFPAYDYNQNMPYNGASLDNSFNNAYADHRQSNHSFGPSAHDQSRRDLSNIPREPLPTKAAASHEARTNSLPKVPGLPEKPSFDAPGVSTATLKQLHSVQNSHSVASTQFHETATDEHLDPVDQLIADAIAGRRTSTPASNVQNPVLPRLPPGHHSPKGVQPDARDLHHGYDRRRPAWTYEEYAGPERRTWFYSRHTGAKIYLYDEQNQTENHGAHIKQEEPMPNQTAHDGVHLKQEDPAPNQSANHGVQTRQEESVPNQTANSGVRVTQEKSVPNQTASGGDRITHEAQATGPASGQTASRKTKKRPDVTKILYEQYDDEAFEESGPHGLMQPMHQETEELAPNPAEGGRSEPSMMLEIAHEIKEVARRKYAGTTADMPIEVQDVAQPNPLGTEQTDPFMFPKMTHAVGEIDQSSRPQDAPDSVEIYGLTDRRRSS